MTDYFLKINGITGDSRAAGFLGSFVLLGYRWEVDGSPRPGVPGLPLVVQVRAIQGLLAVDKKAAAGSRLNTVELQAVVGRGADQGWIFKVLLTNSVVTASTSLLTEEGLVTTWTFGDYSRADVSSRGQDARGAWGPVTTSSWIQAR